MRPPKIIKPYVKVFARQIVRTSSEVDLSYVYCTPLQNVPENECFPIVEEHAKAHGGTGVLGWAIWERPKLFIEAELHMIWKTPEQILKDIVPRTAKPPRILFLCDPNRRYNGRQVDNTRKALTKNKDVKYLLSLFQKKYRLWNEGNLADFHGDISDRITTEMVKLENEIKRFERKITKKYGPWLTEEQPTERGFQ